MSINILIIAYLVLQVIHTHLFFSQRVVVELGRKIGKDISQLVLPAWFHTTSFVIGILKVVILGYMCYLDFWFITIGMGIGLLVICSVLPIPKCYYEDVRKKLENKNV